ncbi:MAG TPA: M15 family metallopeptidase [Polyangiales bacterium]|nr:M15 family metallopeptidase [Polyangiales bacterium]
MTAFFELSAAVRDEMRGVSWHEHPACPSFDALRLVRVRHHSFDGRPHQGELVVHATLAEEVLAIFERIYAAGFPIHSARRIDHFRGSDDASMAANNSSAFNFRVIDGTATLSQHALGRAIDINPVQNPWVRGERVDPEAGRTYLDRTQLRPGMIVRPGPVIAAFEAAGWRWGGDVPSAADYHHFSKA